MNNDTIFNLVPLVVVFPLLGILVNLIVGKKLGERGAGVVASVASGLAFVVAVLLMMALQGNHAAEKVFVAEWIKVGDLSVDWTFRVDTLSVVMMLVVAGVGTLIHIYATGYMHSDVRHNGAPELYRRFFVYFNLFILAMMLLVSADNYLMLFVGWEGVGLCSYLLIGFWFNKGEGGIANAQAGKKAFIVNRIGDFGFLLAIFTLFVSFGTLQFDAIFEQAPQVAAAMPGVILAITLFMLLGVAGKSSQLPLYVWLPDAMAGPTPVSALIHAATMVTAGVYLVARSFALYSLVPAAQMTVAWVGALTAIFAATIAVGQFDIKKVLAYSTISQLGFMVTAVGMGATVAGMFHLVTHAFFKALLFLAAGSVILGLEHGHEVETHGDAHGHDFDPQDMRNMGNLRRKMPVTFWVYLAGALALAGIAPLAGFFSKDEILAAANEVAPALYVILTIAAFLTAFYMARQILMVFFGKARTSPAEKAIESPALITIPLIILALLSVFGGLLNFPGILTLEHWLEHSTGSSVTAHFSFAVAGISLAIAIAGLVLGWLVYGRKPAQSADAKDPLSRILGPVFTGMNRKWWVDELYHLIIVRPYRFISDEVLAQWFDQEEIDGTINNLGRGFKALAHAIGQHQNGYVRTYAITFLFGAVAILTYLFIR